MSYPHIKHFRHRLFPRLRHGRKLQSFLTAMNTALVSTATGQTVSPLHAVNSKAEASLHFAGNLSANDTVTIGNVTYTFKAALTEAKATGTLTNDGTNVTDGDTVTINGKVYTFQGTLTEVDGHVKIGASNTASMTNLFHAINASGGVSGTDYATATTANADVVATNPTGTTVVLTAKVPGVAANALATTEASTHLSFGAATLSGGIDSIANEVFIGALATDTRDNLVAAITAGSGSGTKYAFATVVHPLITAAAASGDMTMTALLGPSATPGIKVPVAKSAANLTLPTPAHLDGPLWTATTHPYVDGEGPVTITNAGGALPAGTPTGELWVHVVDSSTVAFATSLGALRKGDFIVTSDAGTGTQTSKRSTGNNGMFDLLKTNAARTIAAATDIDNLK